MAPTTLQYKRFRWRWVMAIITILILMPIALFLINGLILAHGEEPVTGQYADIPLSSPSDSEVTIVAYNIAKAFAHVGGTQFKRPEIVKVNLKAMADAIREEDADIVFLSEALWECGPCEIDQVAFLAHELGLPYYALGENYNVGFPLYRVVGGNAIPSKYSLTSYLNMSLPGRKPFYVTQNNRRALMAQTLIDDETVTFIALHNDSFDHRNNAVQMKFIHDIAPADSVIAGDFNAQPHEKAVQLLSNSNNYAGAFDGPPTFPADKPNQRIDYVLAPASWTHVETRVIDSQASDHRPVVARFKLTR